MIFTNIYFQKLVENILKLLTPTIVKLLLKIKSGNKKVHNQPNKEIFVSLIPTQFVLNNKSLKLYIKLTQLMKIDSTRHHFV